MHFRANDIVLNCLLMKIYVKCVSCHWFQIPSLEAPVYRNVRTSSLKFTTFSVSAKTSYMEKFALRNSLDRYTEYNSVSFPKLLLMSISSWEVLPNLKVPESKLHILDKTEIMLCRFLSFYFQSAKFKFVWLLNTGGTRKLGAVFD